MLNTDILTWNIIISLIQIKTNFARKVLYVKPAAPIGSYFLWQRKIKNILIFKTLSKSTNECSIIRYVVIAVFVKMYEEENPSNTFKLLLAINKYTGCPKKRSLRYCTTHYGSIFKKVYIFEIFGTFPMD